jgi:hypothetical protein
MDTLQELFKKIENNELILPDFQRDYKWTVDKQRNLLASLLLEFPIGSSLIVEGKSNQFASRKIGDLTQSDIKSEYNCEYLLDGQQRTTTLFNAFNNVYALTNANISPEDKVSLAREKMADFTANKANSMKLRWFIRIPLIDSNNVCPDIFNASTLLFSNDYLDEFEPDEIVGAIECFKFDEKNNLGITKWYSPFYEAVEKAKGLTNRQFDTKLVQSCSEEGLVPLYLLGESKTNGRTLKRILTEIAEKNSRALWDSLGDNIEDYRKYDIGEVLHEFDSFSDITAEGDDKDEILKEVFSVLSGQWVDKVYEHLIHKIYSDYKITSIVTTDIMRAIPIFCHINEGGMKLDDFDLLSARAAKKLEDDIESYSLSQVVREIVKTPLILSPSLAFGATGILDAKFSFDNLDSIEDGIPTGYLKTSILAVCSLLSYGKQCNFFANQDVELTKDKAKSKALLKLSTQEIRDNIVTATTAVLRALAFLNITCGITNAKKLHYTLMIQPIAFAFTNDSFWNDKIALDKIKLWYLTSFFSGAYLYDQSAVVIKDINNVYRWLEGATGAEINNRYSKALKNTEFADKDILTMQGDEPPKESLKAGVLQYVLSKKPYDFIEGNVKRVTSFNIVDTTVHLSAQNKIHDHHLIPVDIRKELGGTSETIRNNPQHILNSPLNRIFISDQANLKIGSLDPSRYFEKLGEAGSYSKQILESNLIPEKFQDINTGKCEDQDILEVMHERFDLFSDALYSEMLSLKTSVSLT